MVFNVAATLDVIHGHVAASGRFSSHGIGEPISPPDGDLLHGAVFMRGAGITKIYGDGGTQEVQVVMVRIYRNVLKQPQADGETELAIVAQEIAQDLIQDFSLGANVREIDIASGQGGEPMTLEWGHVTIDQTIYRVVDIAVPIVVDDSATAAA